MKDILFNLLFEREDKVITICELKYGERKIGIAECKKFQDRVDKLIYLIKNERKYSKYKRYRVDTALIALSDNEDVVSIEAKTGGYFNRIAGIREFEKVVRK